MKIPMLTLVMLLSVLVADGQTPPPSDQKKGFFELLLHRIKVNYTAYSRLAGTKGAPDVRGSSICSYDLTNRQETVLFDCAECRGPITNGSVVYFLDKKGLGKFDLEKKVLESIPTKIRIERIVNINVKELWLVSRVKDPGGAGCDSTLVLHVMSLKTQKIAEPRAIDECYRALSLHQFLNNVYVDNTRGIPPFQLTLSKTIDESMTNIAMAELLDIKPLQNSRFDPVWMDKTHLIYVSAK